MLEKSKEFLKELDCKYAELSAEIGKEWAERINRLKKWEREAAGRVSPELKDAVINVQIVDEKLDNLYDSPGNLFLVGKKMRPEGFHPADHLFVRRGLYTHHGIYIGNGLVIHYSTSGKNLIKIHPIALREFAAGDSVYWLDTDQSPLIYQREEAVGRAWSRVGEESYNLLMNNCEQFVRWCRSGGELLTWK